MKKRILSVLLSIVMVATLLPTTALAEGEVYGHPGHTCSICDHIASDPHKDPNVIWQAWENATALPAFGTYYLTRDVTLSATHEVSGDLTLCLNGFKITPAQDFTDRAISVSGTLNLTDCGTTGAITGFKTTDIDGGAGVLLKNGARFNMYGGSITGNTSSGSGGGIMIYSSSVEVGLYGGSITGNKAPNGGGVRGRTGMETIKIAGSPVVFNNTNGVQASNCSQVKFKIVGPLEETAKFSFNDEGYNPSVPVTVAEYATGVTGNYESCFVHDKWMHVNVRNGSQIDMYKAANVIFHANGGSGTMTSQKVPLHQDTALNRNTFTPPTGKEFSHWSYNPSDGGECILDGGTIYLTYSSDVPLYAIWGDPTYEINKADTENGSFSVPAAAAAGATVTITPTPAEGYKVDTITVTTTADVEPVDVSNNRFTMPDEAVTVTVTFKAIPHEHLLCQTDNCNLDHNGDEQGDGHDESIEWTEWNGTNNITYTNNVAYVYLSCDARRNNTLTVGNGKTLYLCLNGYTLTFNGNSGSAITVENGATLVLTDCSTTDPGKITGGKGHTPNGDRANEGGGVHNAGTFIMYGGKIDNNKVEKIPYLNNGNTRYYAGLGGGVYNDGTFTMHGGTISNNSSSYGGGVDNRGSFTMTGGTISGNSVTSNGGGVYNSLSSGFTMTGGTISGNSSTYDGGGVYSTKPFNLSGNPVINGNFKGTGETAAASNVYLYAMTITVNGTLSDGANIGVTRYDSDLNYYGTIAVPDGENVIALTEADIAKFTSDKSDYTVQVDEGNLKLAVPSTTYKVTKETASNGSFAVTVDSTTVNSGDSVTAGDTVTITATPANGYEVDTVSYTPDSGSATTITPVGGVYSFTMPAANVTVSVTFKKIPAPIISGGDDSSPSNTTSKTEKNEDGSTTTTTTNQATGTVTETTRATDGTTGTTVTDKNGKVTEVSAKVPAAAANAAEKTGKPVSVPVEVPAVKSSKEALPVKVDVPTKGATVEIPVENVTPGTVVVIVAKDGTEQVVRTSSVSENGVVVKLEQDATIKVVDKSRDFKDVHPVNHWAADAVDFVAARGIFNGTSADTFAPNGSMTRQAMWMTLARMSGVEPTDMAAAREWAVENAVSDGSNPLGTVTRQQYVTMLWRWAVAEGMDVNVGEEANILDYTDADKISDYAVDAFRWACSESIVDGYDDGSLRALTNASRAHAAAMMMRFCASTVK